MLLMRTIVNYRWNTTRDMSIDFFNNHVLIINRAATATQEMWLSYFFSIQKMYLVETRKVCLKFCWNGLFFVRYKMSTKSQLCFWEFNSSISFCLVHYQFSTEPKMKALHILNHTSSVLRKCVMLFPLCVWQSVQEPQFGGTITLHIKNESCQSPLETDIKSYLLISDAIIIELLSNGRFND